MVTNGQLASVHNTDTLVYTATENITLWVLLGPRGGSIFLVQTRGLLVWLDAPLTTEQPYTNFSMQPGDELHAIAPLATTQIILVWSHQQETPF